MSLRDRIAKVMTECDLRCDSRLECADALLSDPEIGALIEVATFATCIRLNESMLLEEPSETVDRRIAILTMHRSNLDAALARLEEARRG